MSPHHQPHYLISLQANTTSWGQDAMDPQRRLCFIKQKSNQALQSYIGFHFLYNTSVAWKRRSTIMTIIIINCCDQIINFTIIIFLNLSLKTAFNENQLRRRSLSLREGKANSGCGFVSFCYVKTIGPWMVYQFIIFMIKTIWFQNQLSLFSEYCFERRLAKERNGRKEFQRKKGRSTV